MQIYTDGGCRLEIGGWAWWCPQLREYRSGHAYPTTNQRMELQAALEAINHFYKEPEIVIISDSSYLVRCFKEKWYERWMQNGWKSSKWDTVKNQDIWEPLIQVVLEHGYVTFQWVKGHSGDEGNDRADLLATTEVLDYKKAMDDAEQKRKDRERKVKDH